MTMEKTRDLARGYWKSILISVGFDEAILDGEHHPCPFCGGTDRFRFDDEEGNGTYFCNQCGAGTGIKMVMQKLNLNFHAACLEVERILGRPGITKESPRTAKVPAGTFIGIWNHSRKVSQGDPVWLYLNRRCGLTEIPGEIRFHPSLIHSMDGGNRHPAMVCRMTSPDRKMSGIHRTYLTLDGQKAQVDPVRMSLGELGAVRLAPSGPVLGIAEGIETALCASRIFGIPVWSGICANGMKDWVPPDTVQKVVICGDHDASFTGQAAAYTLAQKLRVKGLEVEIQIPPQVGTDWADVQLQGVA